MENKSKKTIFNVLKKDLCTGCGTCESLCPYNAIIMIRSNRGIYIPKIDKNKCKICEKCYIICPGHSLNFDSIRKKIFPSTNQFYSFGSFSNCFVGYSNNKKIRYHSSSGGVLTQMLIFLLENKRVDGILVTKMSNKNPLEPESFIARNKEDLIQASGSKYCPVPANRALSEIINSENEEKFAIVGLPCHIHGIRKSEFVNKKLKNKILLHIGLFCSINVSFYGTEFFLKRKGIKKGDVKKITYRGNGWPGGMKIELKNGKEFFYSKNEYYDTKFGSFMPWRCGLCCDATSELADISFGDAWLPEYKEDKLGTSIVISRNREVEKILKTMQEKNIIKIKKIDKQKVEVSQDYFLWKKGDLRSRFIISKFFQKKNPVYIGCKTINTLRNSKINAFLYYFFYNLTIRKKLWPFVDIICSFIAKIKT